MGKILDYTEQTSVAAADVLIIDGASGTKKIKASDMILLALDAATSTAGRAGLHNSIYRGKYLGTAVTTAQYTAIANGTFDDLWLGDYWTIGNVNYRIMHFNYYMNCGDTQTTKPHILLVPDSCLYNAEMNDKNITDGAYAGSVMYTAKLATAKTTISDAFSGHVLSHRVYLNNATSNGRVSGGSWYDSTVDLMNEQMVYGSGIFNPVSDGTNIPANYRVEKSQLAGFAKNPALITNRAGWWLRDVVSAASFSFVYGVGYAAYNGASASYGVRPAFCIC